MSDPLFFRSARSLPLAAIAEAAAAEVPAAADRSHGFASVAPLDRATPADVTLFREADALADLRATRAGACLVAPHHAMHVPSPTLALVTGDPAAAFRRVAALLHPAGAAPGSQFGCTGIDRGVIVHADALLEPGVTIDPGAVVGPGAEIGTGTSIGANTTIGAGVRIGRGCAIDANVTIAHALIGDRVVVHAGARLGQGGPEIDHAARPPRLGRVIVQDDVEIGANAVIERGGLRDTVVGEGSRIEALTPLARDTTVGRFTFVATTPPPDERTVDP